jgi:hypothetical protein
MLHYNSGALRQGVAPLESPHRLSTLTNGGNGALNYLGKLSIRNTDHARDAHGRDVLHVRDPHALIQASGYLKFIRAKESEAIFFRGQTETYATLSPTLFRKIGPTQGAQAAVVNQRTAFMKLIDEATPIFKQIKPFSHEPLLQHYGLATTWIDLVDNIWVALWFACHKAHVSGKRSQYLHFERRLHEQDPGGFAYILLIAVDSEATGVPGLFKGENTELVDLRVTCPSIFLRPHAQHGVLFRKRGSGPIRPIDYSSQLRGIIRIGLSDALSWLGDAKTLGVHTLFPPPYYDTGYKLLLDGKFESTTKAGSICLIGA